jgi:hypothetical protein
MFSSVRHPNRNESREMQPDTRKQLSALADRMEAFASTVEPCRGTIRKWAKELREILAAAKQQEPKKR